MSKDLSVKHYQYNKERLQKRLIKDIKILPKKKKRLSDNMVANNIKISMKMKNKGWFSIEKKVIIYKD